ncbi:MAG: imelysin family protein [Deltaproteobacteria bacterium]|nr:imelysin family protein [Deltaproteobacteria bacterium]
MPRSLALCVLLAACGNGGTARDAMPDDGFDRNALLTHLTQKLFLPIAAKAQATGTALGPAIAAYCDALDAGAVGTTLDSARGAWRDAIDAWEAADAVLVGPAAMDNKALRDRIYAWPLLSTCGVDRDTASRWTDPGSYDVNAKLANVRSLATIEYLLFPPFASHTCATSPAGWDAIGADIPRARCRLAQTIAADVGKAATDVDVAWRSDYAAVLSSAGHPGVNLVSDGMFYVDRMVKDMKLAEAAGIAINACGTVGTPCPQEIELRYADRGTFAIRINLATLRATFTGTTPAGDGPGFDDFLIAADHPEVAQRMTAALDTAIAKAAALPDSFTAALSSDHAKIVELHAAIREFTNDVKSQFLTVLSLDIPDDVAADND